MGDVLEYLVDGVSGLAPGGVDGTCIVAGVCSAGEPGKGYLLGKSSDLDSLLGVGPLVDRLRDVFAAGGQNPVVIAVPVPGMAGGYVTAVSHTGDGPEADVTGVPSESADVVIEIVEGGALGTATYRLSKDGGATFNDPLPTDASGQVSVPDTGTTLILDEGTHVAGDRYEYLVRTAIGPVSHVGTGPGIDIAGEVKSAAEVVLRILSSGGRNEGTYQLSVDGGDSWGPERTIPVDGVIAAGSAGAIIAMPDDEMVAGDVYSCRLLPPAPSISAVLDALEQPLDLFDVEFVHVVGPSDSTDWAALGAKADSMWNKHRPTFILAESRLPYASESIDDWVAALLRDRQSYAHRFVSVCAAYGEVADVTGKRIVRNWGGLMAGRILSIPVMRATGRVRDGGISQGTLPESYTEAHQKQLEVNGYATAKHYAGLRSAYWGDAKTLADVTSDYQYVEVLRTVFKAVRLARIAALRSMYDEAGDPLMEGGASGLNYLQAQIENALNTMTSALPRELADHVVAIPPGQDIVNNGVAVEMDLVGIPIIRTIKLFARYIYAGSGFDPRLQ